MNKFYSPFVKTKRGEARALQELDVATKAKLLPLFDVLALSSRGEISPDVKKHLSKQAKMIQMAWAESGECYVDLFDIQPSVRLPDGGHPLHFVLNELDAAKVSYIPVVGLARDIGYLVAMRSVLQNATAIAVRLEVEDLLLPAGLSLRIDELLRSLGARNLPLHIILDCRSLLNQDVAKIARAARASIAETLTLSAVRTTLAASSMVSDMGSFKRNSINRVKRRDLELWMTLAQSGFPYLCYGDYGVIHPDFVDLDGALIKPAAKIRYASHAEWIVVKGFRWVDDTSQHHQLAISLQGCSEYRGGDCPGGNYIETAIAGRDKYGTLETWVTIDQSVHISLTRKQVERVLAPIQAASTSATAAR